MAGRVIDLGNGQQLTLPNIPLKLIIGVVILILVIIGVFSSYYTIETNEQGVVTRFGRFTKVVNPGLHFKLPFGIDKYYGVPTRFTFKEEFGTRTSKSGVRTKYETPRRGSSRAREFERESLMVTGDLNMAQIVWSVQFRISNPKDYLFNLRNPFATLRDISESVMREVVGDMTVTEVLTDKRNEINFKAKKHLDEVLKEYKTGLDVTQVILKKVNPPDSVRAAFNDVNSAQQEKEKTVNQALQAYNKEVPMARGKAQKMISEAEGYALDRINRAKGETNRFLSILEEYKKAPEVMKKRLYLEAIGKILPNLKRKVIIDDQVKGLLPLLDLGRERR